MLIEIIHGVGGFQRTICLGGDGAHQVVKFLRGGFERAAMLMAEHADQADVQFLDRVFQRSDDGTIDELAGGAYGEQVTQALIEDDFRRYARIRAGKHSGVGVLAVKQRLAGFLVLPWMVRLAFGESAIALEHTAPRRICGRFLFNVCLSHENLHYQRTAGTHSSDWKCGFAAACIIWLCPKHNENAHNLNPV